MLNVTVKKDSFYNTPTVDAYNGFTTDELQHVDVAGVFIINDTEFFAYLDADKLFDDDDIAYSDLDCQTDKVLTDQDVDYIWDTLNAQIIKTFKIGEYYD